MLRGPRHLDRSQPRDTHARVDEARSTSGIAREAVRGGGLLGLRQVFGQALNLAGYAVVARLLGPTEVGVLGIVSFVVIFLGTCGGAGLQASLIRLPAEPSAASGWPR